MKRESIIFNCLTINITTSLLVMFTLEVEERFSMPPGPQVLMIGCAKQTQTHN